MPKTLWYTDSVPKQWILNYVRKDQKRSLESEKQLL